MNIQEMHIQNNAYRDLISSLKDKINEYDRLIRANEIEIGKQLEDMSSLDAGIPVATAEAYTCDLCLGECDTHESGQGEDN